MKNGKIQKHGSIAKLKEEKKGYSIKLKLRVPTDPRISPTLDSYDDVAGASSSKSISQNITTLDGLTNYLKGLNYEVKDSHLVSVKSYFLYRVT